LYRCWGIAALKSGGILLTRDFGEHKYGTNGVRLGFLDLNMGGTMFGGGGEKGGNLMGTKAVQKWKTRKQPAELRFQEV